jgi:hypothetical protein
MYSLKAYNYCPFLEYLKNTKPSTIPKSISLDGTENK